MDLVQQHAREALQVVLDALNIPNAATVGEQATRDKILVERAGHARAFLENILAENGIGDVPWGIAYLRDRLAEHPAAGYKTWEERMAELGL